MVRIPLLNKTASDIQAGVRGASFYTVSIFISFLLLGGSGAFLYSEEAAYCSEVRKAFKEIGRSIVNIKVIKEPKGEESGKRSLIASFSGFVTTEKGRNGRYVVTCFPGLEDVVRKCEGAYLQLTFQDLWRDRGRLEAVDECSGISLIRYKRKGDTIPGLEIGGKEASIGRLREGLNVFAISNPFGIQSSLECGVVSALGLSGRKTSSRTFHVHLPAVPAQAGGAVYDFRRNLLGIIRPPKPLSLQGSTSLAILGGSGGSWNTTEVLPACAVRRIVENLAAGREVVRGFIGARFRRCVEEGKPACKVVSVTPGGAAEKAGLKPSDRIKEANGGPVSSVAELYALALWVEYQGVGKDLVLKVSRQNHSTLKLKIPVQSRPCGKEKDLRLSDR